MSSIVPKDIAGRIAFFKGRLALWGTNHAAIGTTSAAVTALGVKITAAEDARAAQVTALANAKSATETTNMAVEAMLNEGMAIIDQVRAKARLAGDSVYPLADLPVPATPTPSPAPGQPYKFTVEITALGAVLMKWLCEGGKGAVYQVWRQVNNGPVTYVGGSGAKEFLDETLAPGTSQVLYQIQAVRSTIAGPWATYMVKLGGGAPLVTQVPPVPIAA